MEKLIDLSSNEMRQINGGNDVLTGYPGQSLVNFILKTLSAAYQHGVDDKFQNIEPCK